MRNKVYILVLLIMLLLPKAIYAESATFSANCSTSVNPGGEINCALTGTADFNVTGIDISFTLGNDLTATSFNSPTGIDNNGINNGTVHLSSTSGITGDLTLGTLKINVGANAAEGDRTITFSNIKYSYSGATDPISVTGTTKTVTINAPAPQESSLKSLSASSGVLTPTTFSPTTYSYGLYLPANTTTFSLTAAPTISGDSVVFKKDSASGDTLNASSIQYAPSDQNNMKILIIVGSGENAKTYTLLVTREQQSTSAGNPTLSSLTLSGQTVNLKNVDNSTEEITLKLNNTSSYQLKAVLSDSTNYEYSTDTLTSACTVSDGTLTCNLSGDTNMVIMVVPKNAGGAKKSYVLNISKSSSSSGGSSGGGSSSGGSSGSGSINGNPNTGTSGYVMGIILILSFAATLYLYKRNMSTYQ